MFVLFLHPVEQLLNGNVPENFIRVRDKYTYGRFGRQAVLFQEIFVIQMFQDGDGIKHQLAAEPSCQLLFCPYIIECERCGRLFAVAQLADKLQVAFLGVD